MNKPKVICLTPVRNEAWILDIFLKAASLWADHIIIADQMSTDGSREIAVKYRKVILIDNKSANFNEPERQKLLINEARKIEAPRLLITLDADEIFTPNILTSAEWQKILYSPRGTIIKFQWANFRPDFKRMWLGLSFPWGYQDDGFQHQGRKIHSARIPLPPDCEVITAEQIKVMHFQYTQWERMKSKHRFYQCYEKINFPGKSAIEIYRIYHHMYAIPDEQIIPIPQDWIMEYKKQGIDITSVKYETKLWFDEQVLNYIEQYGAIYFKKITIWGINWKAKAQLFGKSNHGKFDDPRNFIDKLIQIWLLRTQKIHEASIIQFFDKVLTKLFKY